ncbi:hypothetical protein [Microbulbifer sp. SAOS-129_SWC]|uniref:hypothetical protein n=1 Tax=Microbulbifer sp. SAOS-129_SWC TaxID=3145235 RepID=UPI003216E18F
MGLFSNGYSGHKRIHHSFTREELNQMMAGRQVQKQGNDEPDGGGGKLKVFNNYEMRPEPKGCCCCCCKCKGGTDGE